MQGPVLTIVEDMDKDKAIIPKDPIIMKVADKLIKLHIEIKLHQMELLYFYLEFLMKWKRLN